MIWNMGQSDSWCRLPSCEAFSASFILFENSRRVSSISEKPAGGGLRVRDVRIGGIVIGVGDRKGGRKCGGPSQGKLAELRRRKLMADS